MRTPSLHRPFRCTPYVHASGLATGPAALPPGSTVAALRDGHRRAFRSGIPAEGVTSAFLTAQACSSAAVAPAAAFQIPTAGFVSSFLARHWHTHGLSLAVRASGTPYRNPEPARHAALRDDIQGRTRGGPCGSGPAASAWWPRPHPDRYGHRRFACRIGKGGVQRAGPPRRTLLAGLCARLRFLPSPARRAPPTLRARNPHPHRGEPLRGTLRGVAGVATRRFTRVCYTASLKFWGPLGEVSAASRGQLRSP